MKNYKIYEKNFDNLRNDKHKESLHVSTLDTAMDYNFRPTLVSLS